MQGFRLSPVAFLIILNLIVFIATLIQRDIIYTLGLSPATFSGRPWTILTNLFVHGSFGHIIANMYTLFFFGTYVYRLIGTGRFLTVYFIGGICGNLLYLLLGYIWGIDYLTIAVGASGAIFALGGVLAVLIPKSRVYIFPLPVAMPLWIAVIGGCLILSFFPGIAWQAHVGGLLFGLLSGYYFRKRMRPVF